MFEALKKWWTGKDPQENNAGSEGDIGGPSDLSDLVSGYRVHIEASNVPNDRYLWRAKYVVYRAGEGQVDSGYAYATTPELAMSKAESDAKRSVNNMKMVEKGKTQKTIEILD